MYADRVRNTDGRFTLTTEWTAHQYAKTICTSPAVWSQFSQGSSTSTLGTFKSCVDTVVPGFHARVKKGQVFFNPCDISTATLLPGAGAYGGKFRKIIPDCSTPNQYQQEFEFKILSGSLADLLSRRTLPVVSGRVAMPASVISDSAVSRLITEASTCARSKRGRSPTNLWESLAEANKAAGTIPGIVKSAINVISNANKKSRKNNIADTHLAIVYGLMPIISDISGVLDGIQKTIGKVRETSRCSSQLNGSNTATSLNKTAFASFNYKTQTTVEESIVVRAMSLDEYVATTASRIGFTGQGLVTLPWELIPYSFVVDWFTNVGDFLGALTPDVFLKQLVSGYVIDRQVQVTTKMVDFSAVSGFTMVSPPSDSSHISQYKNKSRYAGLSAPSIVIRSDFQMDNIRRAADAIALIVQKVR